MGNFATGITVVTTKDRSGAPYGLTVNSFTSVSLNPVLVLVCLDNKLSGLQTFKESRHFGVSILSEHQEDLSRMFAKKDSEKPPSIYFEGKLGLPLLNNSLAIMECETVEVYAGEDHQIFLGEVMTRRFFRPAGSLCISAVNTMVNVGEHSTRSTRSLQKLLLCLLCFLCSSPFCG
jgi:flavin reductase (DIM6/NTAB) family NADH-FMN oxidoreductase RutF